MTPSPDVNAAYEAALPDDARVARKKMFGSPCAFIQRQMFFGTFEGTFVARIGPARVPTLAGQGGFEVFTPSEGKSWDDYIQMPGDTDVAILRQIAAEAMAYTVRLPPKAKKRKDFA